LLTVDHGAYYFLTSQDAQSYLRLSSVSDLTVDLADSTIYFAGAFLRGFALVNCERVRLTRFRTDFITPPYTHVELTAFDPDRRTLVYATLFDWADPIVFSGLAAPGPNMAPLAIWAMAFRNGDIVPGTSRMPVTQPLFEGILALVQDNTPWTQAATLSTLHPGDTIVVFVRGGFATVSVTGGDAVTISDATIHGSSAQAILFNGATRSTAERVRVTPRPNGGLIATDAGGIILVNTGPDSHIRHSFVNRSLDDALAIYTIDVAAIASQSGPRELTVDRIAFLRFPDGTRVNFVDPASGEELPGATIVSQDPPDSNAPVFNGPVNVTFDRDLPTLSPGFGMTLADPGARGAGSSIEDNVVKEVPFGRGVFSAGVEGLTIARNKIGHTSAAGIGVRQNTTSIPFGVSPTPPAHDIVIRDNIIRGSLGPMASGSGTQFAVGAIMIGSTNNTNRFPASTPNSDISIVRNQVIDSGRTGIWIGELDGGAIRGNVITSWDQHPELPLNGVDPQTRPQLLQDFTQPLVIHNSQNIESRDNLIGVHARRDDDSGRRIDPDSSDR
jgi:hypothetical protein